MKNKKTLSLLCMLIFAVAAMSQELPKFSRKDPAINKQSLVASIEQQQVKAAVSKAAFQVQGKAAVVANSILDAKYDGGNIAAMTSYTPTIIYDDVDNSTINAVLTNANGVANGLGFIYASTGNIAGFAIAPNFDLVTIGFDGKVNMLPRTSPVDIVETGIRSYSLKYTITGAAYYGGKLYLCSPFYGDGTLSTYVEGNKQLATGEVVANLPIYSGASRVQFDSTGNAYVLDPFEGHVSMTDARTKTPAHLFDVDAPIAFRLLANGSLVVLCGSYMDYDSMNIVPGRVIRVDLINGQWTKKLLAEGVQLGFGPFGDIISSSDGKDIYYTSADGEISRIQFDRLGNYVVTRFLSRQQSATNTIGHMAFATNNGQVQVAQPEVVKFPTVSTNTSRYLNR